LGSKRKAIAKSSTASIPIARQAMSTSYASEQQMAQDKEEADYKDFVFFSRVVDGISRQNTLLQDGSYLKSTNQTLLDSIVKSRHEEKKVEDDDNDNEDHYNYYPSKQQCHQDFKIVTPTRDHYNYAVLDSAALDALPLFPEHDEHEHEQNNYDDHHHHYDHHQEEDEGVFDFEL